MSKASRRSSRTTRGAGARPIGSGSASGGPAGGLNRSASLSGTNPPGAPTPDGEASPPIIDAAALPAGPSAGPRPAGSRPTGSRAGSARPSSSSRPRRTLYQPSFFERHRTAILGGGLVAVVAVVGALFFLNATAAAYSCATTTQPLPSGTPLPNGSPAPLGQPQPDMGNLHISVGSSHQYAYCPPASGPHYSAQDNGPIAAKFYGPDDGTKPEGWIHNMEHGAVVILYNCKMGACDAATQTALQAIPVGFPDSPVCGVKAGNLAPVVARFDDMPAKFAALVWDRVLYMSTLDVNEIKTFYATQGELYNPEPQCTRPSPSPSVAPSTAPSASPAATSSDQPSLTPSSAPSPTPSSAASPAAS